MFLPPANEVWGKVIFSETCVKNSVDGGGLPQCMLGYPPGSRHPLSRQPPGAGTPPHRSRACWEIRSTSGRYASYWNAFLFKIIFLAKSHVGTPGRSVPHPRRILDQINKISTQSKTAKIQDCTDSPGSIRYSA